MTAVIRRDVAERAARPTASLPPCVLRSVDAIAAELAGVLDLDQDDAVQGYALQLVWELEAASARREQTAALRARLADLAGITASPYSEEQVIPLMVAQFDATLRET